MLSAEARAKADALAQAQRQLAAERARGDDLERALLSQVGPSKPWMDPKP